MKYSEIKNLEPAELKKRMAQNRQALFTARMKHKMQRLSNMMELRKGRKDIARLNTALSALPASAFVTKKKSSGQKNPMKPPSALTAKQKEKEKTSKQAGHKGDKPQKPAKDSSTTLTAKQAPKPGTAQPKKKSTKKSEAVAEARTKTKKWFGFFGSKAKSPQKSSAGKRSFFRRKSG